jgi:hypothetical protein
VLLNIALRTAVVYALVLIGLDYHNVALGVLEVDVSISLLKYDEINPNANTHLVRRKGIEKKQ